MAQKPKKEKQEGVSVKIDRDHFLEVCKEAEDNERSVAGQLRVILRARYQVKK